MHFGIEIIPLGEYADPKKALELAVAAEDAGWDGVFLWDHLGFVWGAPSADPWVALAAIAARTHRLRLGTMVTPVPRRRPQVLANTLATLDQLSGGRVIFGAGLGGVDMEFSAFGEETDPHVRAEKLDEALELLDRLLSGEPVTHIGRHYQADDITLAPLPVQPRIPFWIGGESPAALRRAAKWDGWVVGGLNENYEFIHTPETINEKISRILRRRQSNLPFEIAMTGISQPGDSDTPRQFAQAGVTWWLESFSGLRGSRAELVERIKAGPPKL